MSYSPLLVEMISEQKQQDRLREARKYRGEGISAPTPSRSHAWTISWQAYEVVFTILVCVVALWVVAPLG